MSLMIPQGGKLRLMRYRKQNANTQKITDTIARTGVYEM